MNQQNAIATPVSPAPGPIEVILIGSAGVWAKGPTLDAAFANAKRFSGTLGKEVVIVVAPIALETWVDEVGALRWKGDLDTRPSYVHFNNKGSSQTWWPNRRTAALRAAVEAKVAAVAAATSKGV
jgi:hypothetical protein